MANLGNASSPVTTEEADTTTEAEVDDIDETQLDTVETEVDVSTAGTEVDVAPAEPAAPIQGSTLSFPGTTPRTPGGGGALLRCCEGTRGGY